MANSERTSIEPKQSRACTGALSLDSNKWFYGQHCFTWTKWHQFIFVLSIFPKNMIRILTTMFICATSITFQHELQNRRVFQLLPGTDAFLGKND